MGRRMGFIGLDLGSVTMRAVQLAWTGTAVELVQVAALERPGRPNGKPKAAELAPLIRHFLHEGRFRGRDVVTAVSHEDSVIRVVRLPRMPEEELGAAVKWEAERYIPFAASDCVTDHAVLGEIETDGASQVEVLLVAARRSSVEATLEAVRKAGYRSVGIEAEALAAGRALLHEKDGEDRGGRLPVVLLCDIGHGHTNISVFRGDALRIHRSVAVGGAIMVERAARAAGVEASSPRTVFSSLSGQSRPTSSVLGSVWDELVNELNRSIDFCHTQEGEQAERVLLTGGALRVPGLVDYLREKVSVPVEVPNPVDRMVAGRSTPVRFLTEAVPELTVAVGLALRGLKRA